MICYLFAFFDRINISFAKIQLQSDLGFSDTVYGLGASLFTVGYVLFEVPSNVLLYKVGARKWIARIMVSWGLATAAMIFVRGEWSFYVLRFLIGAMEAGFSPGVLYYMTLWFPASHRGRATSLFFLASAFSGVIGAPVSGLILSYLNGAAGLPGWQWLFLAGGVPCVLLGIIVFFYLDDRIEDARWLTPDEKRILAGHVARDTPEAGSHTESGRRTRLGFLCGREAGRLVRHESRRQAMARVAGHLSVEDLEAGFRSARDPTAARHFQVIWLLARGHTIADVAAVTSFVPRWIEQLLARYNAEGPEALGDLRRRNGGVPSVLRPALLERLRARLTQPPPDGGLWSSRKVAAWMASELGLAEVLPQCGWEALKAIGGAVAAGVLDRGGVGGGGGWRWPPPDPPPPPCLGHAGGAGGIQKKLEQAV